MIVRSVVILMLLLSSCCGGTIDPEVADAVYVNYGKKFPNVIRIMTFDAGNKVQQGSAVVIGPKWTITSAHIVDKDKKLVLLIKDDKTALSVKKIIVHKNFDRPKTVADIALLYTDESMGMESYPELYSNNDELNKVCSMSGYGLTGNFNTGITISDGLKRAGKNKITNISNDMLICKAKKDDPKTLLDYLIGPGDSGGGMFIDEKLAGINCCVLSTDGKPDADYDDESGFMRISQYRDWILENTKE